MTVFTETEARIAAIIVEHLGCEAIEVQRDVTFDHLRADSLDMVELTMALEEEFTIEIADDEAEKVSTVQDAFSLVNRKLEDADRANG